MSSLQNETIVVTRAIHQAGDLMKAIGARGGTALYFPAIAIVPPDDPAPLDQALLQINEFDLVVLTSANTVAALGERFKKLGIAHVGYFRRRFAAIGEATAEAAKLRLGVKADVFPEAPNEFARAIGLKPGARVLLPQSSIAAPDLANALAAHSAHITAVAAYQTVRGTGNKQVLYKLRTGTIDAFTFTSGSTVRHTLALLDEAAGGQFDPPVHLGGIAIACMGASAAREAAAAGLIPIIAHEATIPSLLDALEDAFHAQRITP